MSSNVGNNASNESDVKTTPTTSNNNIFDTNSNNNNKTNLVYSAEKIRRTRIILAAIGILVALTLVITALTFIIRGFDSNQSLATQLNGIHLDDVLHGKLAARLFNGTWTSDSNGILYKDNDSIMEYNVRTQKSIQLFHDELHQYLLYEKSADGQFLLLGKNFKRNFRHSYVADFDVYNITDGHLQPLLIQNQQRPLMLAQWSPVGNALVLNYERNLYYKATPFANEIALTTDQNPSILNGVPDWVYEEEVISSNSATWFSPDGKQLAFMQFDDTPTNVINFPVYGEAGDIRFQYPYYRLVAYPKAGSPNPRVRLITADLVHAVAGNTNFLTDAPIPGILNTLNDNIITVVDWVNETHVLSVWMNRIQNFAYIQLFNGRKKSEIYNMASTTGWVDLFSAPLKNQDGSHIALILPQKQNNSDAYRHLCLLSTTATAPASPIPLTSGRYVVTALLYWNTISNIIFYKANTELHPEQLHVYAIKATTRQIPKCLTCKLHYSGGVEQSYYTADFNNDHHVAITSLGPGIPMSAIYKWSYENNQVILKQLITWELNENLFKRLKKFDMPRTEIHTVPIGDNFTAKVLLQLPPNMDRSGKTKYPLLVDVYGGPDSYSVVNKWNMDWGVFLSSNQFAIYAKIDGRGSGLRGEKLLHSIYLKLGTVEITDQIQVTRYLQEKLPFIDGNHTGIWGWSYGGYAAAMSLASDDDHIFRCGASIAPVTDWAYYDSIYTERYMSLPELNEKGYQNSRLSTKAVKLKGKTFLLIHGTLDDNVHYQQAMILAKNLERHDILFKQISYPDEDHALAGVRPHLYHSLNHYFGECFGNQRMTLQQ